MSQALCLALEVPSELKRHNKDKPQCCSKLKIATGNEQREHGSLRVGTELWGILFTHFMVTLNLNLQLGGVSSRRRSKGAVG